VHLSKGTTLAEFLAWLEERNLGFEIYYGNMCPEEAWNCRVYHKDKFYQNLDGFGGGDTQTLAVSVAMSNYLQKNGNSLPDKDPNDPIKCLCCGWKTAYIQKSGTYAGKYACYRCGWSE
jgi:hypothetical protein